MVGYLGLQKSGIVLTSHTSQSHHEATVARKRPSFQYNVEVLPYTLTELQHCILHYAYVCMSTICAYWRQKITQKKMPVLFLCFLGSSRSSGCFHYPIVDRQYFGEISAMTNRIPYQVRKYSAILAVE